MPTFGYHAVYDADFRSAIESAAKCGFQYIQFDLNVPQFYLETRSQKELRQIDTIASDAGVRLSFHAPGDIIGLFTDFPLIRKGILDHFKRILDRANFLNAHHLTVHPLSPPSFRRADILEDTFQRDHHGYYKEILKENLTTLARTAGRILIVVENLYLGPATVDALTEMLAAGTDIFLTLDYAKMHSSELTIDPGQEAFFTKHKGRIRELHLHDQARSGMSHLSPGRGAIDFTGLFRSYYEPSQWLTIEVRPLAEAASAMERFAELLNEAGGT